MNCKEIVNEVNDLCIKCNNHKRMKLKDRLIDTYNLCRYCLWNRNINNPTYIVNIIKEKIND